VLPIIRDILAAGHSSLNGIAGQLNARKVATANGGQWRHVQVRQILDRAASGKPHPKVKRFGEIIPAT
jgi:Recombinase